MKRKFSKYEDLELLKLLRGEKREAEAAFAEIYARYSQRIYAYCARILGEGEDAKDVFQETFLKFFDAAKSNDKLNSVNFYLFKIARNICLNYKRDKKVSYNLDDYQIAARNDDYERIEIMELLKTALDLLEFDYREAFILRQYQGMAYKDIATITGDSVSAVKNRVWRAKEKIKEILSPYLEDYV